MPPPNALLNTSIGSYQYFPLPYFQLIFCLVSVHDTQPYDTVGRSTVSKSLTLALLLKCFAISNLDKAPALLLHITDFFIFFTSYCHNDSQIVEIVIVFRFCTSRPSFLSSIYLLCVGSINFHAMYVCLMF